MMQFLAILLAVPVAGWTGAVSAMPKKITTSFSGRAVIQHVLGSEDLAKLEAAHSLDDLVEVRMKVAQQPPTSAYLVTLTYRTAGLGQRGPTTRPCFVDALVEVVVKNEQGITHGELGAPEWGRVVCAQNQPRPR